MESAANGEQNHFYVARIQPIELKRLEDCSLLEPCGFMSHGHTLQHCSHAQHGESQST